MIQKKIIGLFLSGLLISTTTPTYATVSVNGYYRSDGTYVQPHYRSDPDGDFSNNWSTKGNVNPYTGQEGTKTYPEDSGGISPSAPVLPPPASSPDSYNNQYDEYTKQVEENKKSMEQRNEEYRKSMEQDMEEFKNRIEQSGETTQKMIDETQQKMDEIYNNSNTNKILSGSSTENSNTDSSSSTDTYTDTLNTSNNEQADNQDSNKEDHKKTKETSSKSSIWDKFVNFIKGLFS